MRIGSNQSNNSDTVIGEKERLVILKDYIKLLASSQKKYWWVYLLLFAVWIPVCGIGTISIYFYGSLYLPTSFDIWVNIENVSYSICTLIFAVLTSHYFFLTIELHNLLNRFISIKN